MTSLDPIGSPDGLKAWSLDPTISALGDEVLLKLLVRARNIVSIYGPYDLGVQYGNEIIHEIVYAVAEIAYYRSRSIRALISPYVSERIGSYTYTMKKEADFTTLLEENDLLWPLISYLQDRISFPIVISTRVIDTLPANPVTGIRAAIQGYDDRVIRAVKFLGIVSDTSEFNRLVYHDQWAWI